MRTLRYFLAYYYKPKEILHQLDFIGAFLQANNKKHIFVKLDSRYGEYLPEHVNYFGRPFKLKESMYGMTNSEKICDDELTNWLIDEVFFKQSQYQI